MPRVIATDETEAASLGDIVEALESRPFDARDEDAFAAFAPMLKRLANDRTFLARIVAEDLERRCAGQNAVNGYGPQVIMLHAGGRFTVRANIWPDARHSLVRANGARAFFYEVPHDHNVSFLTVGYAGPGYWSDYYDYDYGAVAGVPGEPVALRFVERGRLEPGKVQLYRAHRDVHSQLPPDSLSVSLNVMESSPAATFRDQYLFDTGRSTVAAFANLLPHEPLFAAAAALGGVESLALLDEVAATHGSARLRFAALRARAAAGASRAERREVFATGLNNDDGTVRGLTRARLAEIDTLTDVIEPLQQASLGQDHSNIGPTVLLN